MIFFMAFMLIMFGIIMAGIVGIMPIQTIIFVPYSMRITLFMVGLIIGCMGLMILWGRAKKTGGDHILEIGRPSKILWFYVYRDGTIKITPTMREVEGHLYSPELDAQIQDMKSYRLFDHPVRIVPEGIGHAVDLGMCLYAQFLKTKYGFENMREARDGRNKFIPFMGGSKPILSNEMTKRQFKEYLKKEKIVDDKIIRKV